MSEELHTIHNVEALIYLLVFQVKSRRVLLDSGIDSVVKDARLKIEKR